MLIYVTCCIMARYDKFFSKGDYGMKEGKREEILRLKTKAESILKRPRFC